MISTVHASQDDLLRAIMALYCPTGWDCDQHMKRAREASS